ncbi:glycosyl hydrolase family 8 [Paenibacillus lautus]|uniref:glycosyl hydrolase family 8 n=1 Tax=Paenibacillus lautus TaxID=1401 RepID=UPI002DBA9B88|nr:glycosyl hydrolase family 8 [Paenibacillus lautus]MEC0201394.1 glycosyl hydrolase family 8 [Paenibacillus lautus]
MRIKKERGRIAKRLFLLLLALLLIPWTLPANSHADSVTSKPELASDGSGKAAEALIAEWVFKNKGEGGVHPATGGLNKSSSILQQVGGYFEYYDSKAQDISYQGWDNGQGKKYWLAMVSTSAYKNVKLSSEQSSSGSAPNDFKVQVSTDRTVWTDVPGGTVQMNIVSSYNCPNQSCILNNLPLPNADDKQMLYIRWVVNSNKPTNPKDNPNGIGSGGSSKIRNIRVTGEPISGTTPEQPTIDLSYVPEQGAEKVSVTTPIEVKFNKPITVTAKQDITVRDGQNQPVPSLAVEVINEMTLRIGHGGLAQGKSYRVTIPQTAVQGKDGSPLIRNIEWSFTTVGSVSQPKLINMTLNGDPKTSMAFAWYTDTSAGTKVQVAESTGTGNVFPKEGVLEFTGTSEEISTYMTKGDRTTGKKKKFFSHKASANGLKPGTDYVFRVGDGSIWSSVGSFKTDTATPQPYRFIVGADSQASSKSGFEPWADTFKKAYEHIGNPKFLINAGDLVDNGDLEEQWQWMLGLAQEHLMKVPFVPVLGGHEVSDWDGDATTPNNNFYNHFNLPRKVVDATHDGSVYSFEYGDALYMVYNSQFDGKLNEDGSVDWEDDQHEQFWNQIDWMRNTVAKTDKKWKFVTLHKAPYAAGDNSAQWEGDRVEFYRKNLIPVFDELGIDMVFEAHDHMYMRSFQMYGDKVIDPKKREKDEAGNVVNPQGTVYLMSNAFGNKFYYKNEPYDDYFAAINNQPKKKMFTDVSVSDQILKFDAYTAAIEDEGKSGYGKNGLKVYDHYGIKRTDTKPDPVEGAQVKLQSTKATLTWKTPASSKEQVRGFRIYEQDDKISKHWSLYVPVKSGTSQYSAVIDKLNPDIQYNLVIKSVGRRDNSSPVTVSTSDHAEGNEPPSAVDGLAGKGVSPFQIDLTWRAPSGKSPDRYHIYRNDRHVGTTKEITYIDTGLTPDTEYRYKVTAVTAGGVESLPSAEIRLKTMPSSQCTGPYKPFPQHTAYTAGSIKPNHLQQAQLDATVARLYDEWKQKYLKKKPYLQSSEPDQYYVWYADGDWFQEEYDEELKVNYQPMTVSEAHGYGMLITAHMAGHDPKAKAYFDGLYRYFRAHPSKINPDLMAWKQGDTGQAIVNVGGVDSATDGDMDIAYALLLADRQWGSDGETNYLAEAKKVIDAIMKSDVNHAEWTLKLADWVSDDDAIYGSATRPSDFMLQHLKDFKNASGDANWDRVIDKTYSISEGVYKKYSPNAGLLPDFVVKKNGSYAPADPIFLESETDGDFSYNSSRIPWRIGTDALMTGETRAKEQLNKMTSWIRQMTGDDPNKIYGGYKLDGSKALVNYTDTSFSAPMMVSAMINPANQAWLNRLWDHNASISTNDDVYFGNTLRLLSMIVVSGNWWSPTIADTEAPMQPIIEEAVAVSDSSVELRWIPSFDNAGIAEYKVYRNNSVIGTSNTTDYKDSGLTPNTTYQYFIVAYDTSGNMSKISNVRIVSTGKP